MIMQKRSSNHTSQPLIGLRVQTINIEFRLTGVPIRFVKFAPLRKLRSSAAGQPPIYYLFESESVQSRLITGLLIGATRMGDYKRPKTAIIRLGSTKFFLIALFTAYVTPRPLNIWKVFPGPASAIW
jgi:hypothetical protein